MASTYSTSLKLELMATGDQTGTWGVTNNKNLGTLLEQAITGVLSVAQGDVANLTLTSLDGASDQARNAVINLTGAMTAGRNVVVPTANKVYLVKNSTTGGFAVTVKTAAGSGVAVPAGTARWVYCDGTNVVDGLGYAWSATATALRPDTSDGMALGTSTLMWSDLFLASGGVVNWNNGDVLITHSANLLTFSGASSGYVFDAALKPSANDAAALGASGTAWADLFLADGAVVNWDAGAGAITYTAGAFNINSSVVVGLTTGGTYNGNTLVQTSDQFPAMAFRSGTTVKVQHLADVNAGAYYIDAPGGYIIRDTINGGNQVLATAASQRVVITGSLNRGAPVTKTSNFTVADGENWIINNRGATNTVTLPAAASYPGREIMMSTIQAFTVISASSNVVPRTGGAAGTAILPATDGAWVTLVSNGSNWIIMQGTP